MNLIDAHFHLDQYKNHKEIYEAINKLKQYTLCMTNSPDIYETCMNYYNETKYLKFALGFHPQCVTSKTTTKFFLLNLHRTKYIGEVGLDYSNKYYFNKESQKSVFDQILNQCKNKIISIHCVRAEDDLIEILKKHINNQNTYIIHWFNGNSLNLEKLNLLNCYFSINPNQILSKEWKEYKYLLDLNKIIIETDGPHLNKKINNNYIPSDLNKVYNIIKLEFSNINDFEKVIYNNFKKILQDNIKE